MKEALKKTAPWLLSMGLFVLAIILTFRECGPTQSDTVTVIHDTIPGDPYPVEVPRYVPTVRWQRFTDTIRVEAISPTDTPAIVRDYLTVRFYADTLKNDTSMLAIVEDSVQANRIISRKFTYQNRRPTAIQTTIIQPPTKESFVKVYAGAFAGYSAKNKTFAVGPEISVSLRPGPLIRYGYDIANKGHFVSAGWKISFKRKGKK